MNILNKTWLTIILILFALSTFSQRLGYREITEKRIEFIAPRLNLNAQESEKFWPIFRQFHEEREQISKKTKLKNNQVDNRNPSTNEDFLNAINFMIESKIDQTSLMKDYTRKYLEILPPEKVFRLYQLDEEFNKFLLNQLKESGQGKRK
jgi:uncharacterized protein YktA (UPF0223 family)